jgi:hypothetical protein
MKRVIAVGFVLALLAALPAGSIASSSTHVKFTHWRVLLNVAGHGAWDTFAADQRAPTICSSWTIYTLHVYSKVSGPSHRPVREIWTLNGNVRDRFTDPSLASITYFGIRNPRGLPFGKWSLKITSLSGRSLGSTWLTLPGSRSAC